MPVFHGSSSTELYRGFTAIKLKDIIDLCDYEYVENMDFIYKYMYANILVVNYSQATEFSLRLHQSKWYASMKKDGSSFPLVDPLDFKAGELMDYLRSICHEVHNPDDMGDFDGIASFRVDDQLVFGMFWFGDDLHGQWASLRLLYSESASDAAEAALNKYKLRRIFG